MIARRNPLNRMEQLLAFCDWERKNNPHPQGAPHVAEWAAAEIERLTAENFALAAGQCVNVTGDEGGRLRCAEIERLNAALDDARAEASVAYLAFEQVKASRAELRKAIAALLDDDDRDTAKALARAALKGHKP
jgi:hypothetical protein